MKKNKFKKILGIAFFTIAIILSCIFMGKVAINYNLSDYLDDSTQTKVALNIIDDEFGITGNIQVMVENVNITQAEEINDKIKEIDHVINVNFDKYDENYYANNNALYVVIIDGDDYSNNAKQVAQDIKQKLSIYEKVEYGGTAIEKQALQDSITNEMVLIIAISLCLVSGILLITSESWIEPIILLICSGVAVLINKGTNIFFGEISYITNSISSILQLALSVDYSIVLLHAYREKKKETTNNDEAMKEAIKNVIKPVSASALTTIAGLLALLFMSFKIGFDIGIVLMKGIIISCITSLTLLPILTLIFDKLLQKTKKKAFNPKGKCFYKTSIKAHKIIFPLALVIICLCGFLQSNNSYIFTDTKVGNEAIINNFGQNNSVVIVYKNSKNNYENEKKIINSINNKYKDEKILSTYTAYSNTVRENYTVEKAIQKLDLTNDEANMLFTMYNLYQNNELLELSNEECINMVNELIKNDNDAKEFIDVDTQNIVENIIAVTDLMNSNNTYQEFYNKINSLSFDTSKINEFSLQQMYGLYFYDQIEDDKVDFLTMLDFIISCSNNDNLNSLLNENVINQLSSLSSGIKQFENTMEMPLTKEQLKAYMYNNFQVLLSDEQLEQIYVTYYQNISQDFQDTIPLLNILTFMNKNNLIDDEQAKNSINNYNNLYGLINNKYAYKDYLNNLSLITFALTNEMPIIKINDEAIQQMYILFFKENNIAHYGSIEGRVFVKYVFDTIDENSIVANQIADSKDELEDMHLIDSFMSDKSLKTYKKMYNDINTLSNNIKSSKFTNLLDEDKISGIYIKYAQYKNIDITNSMMAYELLDFINEQKDNNSLLIKKLDENKLAKITEANDNLAKANDLFVGDNYSRLLLSVNLPNESKETTEFVKYLSDEVKNVFGNDAYITGEIVSTYDLEQSFSHDNLFITIFTLISIFIIVMIIFKSISLPTILVTIIQGAIFIAMSTQLLSNGIFFMSYIVVTCILMGATIDYGILLSSSYIENRYKLDKKESLEKAIYTAMPTIFTSGLILTLCGFVIHFVSSQNSIATVGLLLGIGTIYSIIMITIVLPSTLYLLDKFVMKLTYKKSNK